MKKFIKVFAITLASTLLTLSLSGCQGDTLTVDSPVSLAVIYCQRQGNSTAQSYFDACLDGEKETLLYKASSPGSEMIIITSSGEPYQKEAITIPNSDAVTPEQADDDQYYFSEKNKEKLVDTFANAPEADTFSALKIASDWLKNQPDEYPKYCLIIDNGICTTGPLSFLQEGFLTAQPKDIVNQLSDKGYLVDLTGVTVVFNGLGRTSSPQLKPGNTAQTHLETLWELIVTESGGKAVIAKDNREVVASESQYPVSVVRFIPDQPLKFDPITAVNFEQAQFLGEDQVQFDPANWTYLEPIKAEEVIRPIANYMLANNSFRLLLIGTTAGDETTDYDLKLSKNRANTVKNTLVSFGVAQENIITVGSGSSNPWHIYGLGTSSPEASLNRKVVLLPADSEEAKAILKQ